MQKIILLIYFLFICLFNAYTQTDSIRKINNHKTKVNNSKIRKKAYFSLDTIFYLGKPVARYKTIGTDIFGGISDYTVYSLTKNEDLIHVNFVHVNINVATFSYYDITFLTLNKKMQMSVQNDELTVICSFNIFNDSGIIEENVDKLILSKSLPFTNKNQISKKDTVKPTPEKSVQTYSPKIVDRDKKGSISTNGSIIKQSTKAIGSYKVSTETKDNLKVKIYTFYFIDGSQCANATIESSNSTEITILTDIDNKIHVLNILNSSDLNRIIEYLILNNYL